MSARILVIEDNAANLDLMTYLLKAFGHTTLTALNGQAGIALARQELPDLIVCDIQMPVMSGHDVARVLKNDPCLAQVPLVAVTAFAMVGDRDRILATGFDGYIAKPIVPITFVEQLEAFLPQGLRCGPMPSAEATAESCPLKPTGATVLVVDNVKANAEFARSLLEQSGYQVMVAGGMQQALALARDAPPNLILSDVSMGDLSGYDFIGEVKADSRLRGIPFVFLTSTMNNERERKKGLALGAARFLFRPIDPQDLLNEIRSCLQETPGSEHGNDFGC